MGSESIAHEAEENVTKFETCWMEMMRQMVNSGWSRLPTPEDADDTEFRLSYSNKRILHVTKKQQSQKANI